MRRMKTLMSKLASLPQMPELPGAGAGAGTTRLAPLGHFGKNPGVLDAFAYIPDKPTALVVVLHGCTQSAAIYDRGSGWSDLGERHGFAVLYPQQSRANNPNLCFNWYEPADARRDRGEAESIAQMVRHLAKRHDLTRDKVFITGLSAGGAMSAVMLATYPELFAGGAIIAGLPFASANTLPEALARMRGQGSPPRRELSLRAGSASGHSVAPPRLSVWHGTADTLVVPDNATAIVDQWRDLHGLGHVDGRTDTVAGHKRTRWTDAKGQIVVERYDIAGMGHGTPLSTRDAEACGTAGPHMLEAAICSTREIARSWGLTGKRVAAKPVAANAEAANPIAAHAEVAPPSRPAAPARPSGVGAVIEDALRAAGLMR